MPSAIVAGGGIAGLAAAAALGSAGFNVQLFEARPFLGGRATSYDIPTGDGGIETIDNCQHVLLRCCVNLLDLYRRLSVLDHIEFHKTFHFVEPGGRTSVLQAGGLPAPLHFAGSFLRLSCLDFPEKVALGRALLALRREYPHRKDLDRITMADWLEEKRQPKRVVDRFWRQVLVSAINEDLERMAARHGFQVFWLGFLAHRNSYEMGVPSVGLGKLYASEAWRSLPNVHILTRTAVERMDRTGVTVGGQQLSADVYLCALPFERVAQICPEFPAPPFEHSPITGVHLWLDRSVTSLPHATLLDRTMQWMFNKDGGRVVQLVVSASRALLPMSREQIIELALTELRDFFPQARSARLLRAHVVKEVRATFSAAPGLERPTARTAAPNVFLAGDWTASGWPATMEGAARSGYLAAEAAAEACGCPASFVVPDIA